MFLGFISLLDSGPPKFYEDMLLTWINVTKVIQGSLPLEFL